MKKTKREYKYATNKAGWIACKQLNKSIVQLHEN